MESFAVSVRYRGDAQPTGEEGHGDKDRKKCRDSSQNLAPGRGLFSLVTHRLLPFLLNFSFIFSSNQW